MDSRDKTFEGELANAFYLLVHQSAPILGHFATSSLIIHRVGFYRTHSNFRISSLIVRDKPSGSGTAPASIVENVDLRAQELP